MNRQTLKILYLLGVLVSGCVTLGTLLLAPPTLRRHPQTQILTETISDIYEDLVHVSSGLTGKNVVKLVEVEWTIKLQYPDIVEKGSTILIQVMISISETMTNKFI